MLQTLRIWKLSSALKSRDAQDAYSAVRELGRLGTPSAIALLVQALSGDPGVARAAARELGQMGDAQAVEPLISLLGKPNVSTAAVEALAKLGPVAVDRLIRALDSDDPMVRRHAAGVLGSSNDKRAVDPLVDRVQTDHEYAVRTAAATALGHLRDARAVWVLVATLKLRDETSHERRQALENLRQAAQLALRRIGDPLAVKKAEAESFGAKLDEALSESEVHPRLEGDLSPLSDEDLVRILQELVAASEEITWAKLESRPPMLAAYFREYHHRRRVAETVGLELQRRGGLPLLAEVLKRLNNYQSIQNWWAGMNEE